MDATDVVVERDGNRVHLYAGWFPGVSEMCKRVAGAAPHYEGDKFKYWTYPLNLMTVRALREVFSDMLVLGPEITAWGREAVEAEQRLAALGRSRDTELMRVPEMAPKIAQAMAGRTYQRVGARFIAEGREVALWDQPSLGKTLQYLGGIVEADVYYGQHLVCAPKTSLDTVWDPEIRKWLDDAAVFYMPEGRAKRENVIAEFLQCIYPAKFLVINPEMLQVKMGHYCKQCDLWFEKGTPTPDAHIVEDHPAPKRQVRKMDWPVLFEQTWNSIMVDEADRYLLGIRGPNKKTQTGEGAMRLRSAPGGVRVAATGTPFRGKVRNAWGMLHWIRPKEYTSFWHWAQAYLETSDNGFGVTVGNVKEYKRAEFYSSLDGLALRRTKREVQSELPEKDYQNHWVHMSEKQAKQYRAMETQGESELESGTVMGTGVLAEMTRLKQFAFGVWDMSQTGTKDGEKVWKMKPVGSPKMDLVVEMLTERGVSGDPEQQSLPEDGGHKYMIASQYTEVVDFAAAHLRGLGIECDVITGAVTQKRRTEIAKRFQSEDGPRVLVVNTKAAGVALTLDAHCDEMFVLDETFVPDDQEQLEGRIDNRAVEKRVAVRTFHYIRTKETVEEAIAEDSAAKDEVQRTLLDGRRGVSFALRLIRRDRDV